MEGLRIVIVFPIMEAQVLILLFAQIQLDIHVILLIGYALEVAVKPMLVFMIVIIQILSKEPEQHILGIIMLTLVLQYLVIHLV